MPAGKKPARKPKKPAEPWTVSRIKSEAEAARESGNWSRVKRYIGEQARVYLEAAEAEERARERQEKGSREAVSPPLGGKNGSREPTEQKISRALALLFKDPNLSMRKIAKAVGTSHTTLSRDPKFAAAWEAARGPAPPRGHKQTGDKETRGRLEAYDPEE